MEPVLGWIKKLEQRAKGNSFHISMKKEGFLSLEYRFVKRGAEAVSKRYFLNLVRQAYVNKDSSEHLTIQKWARIWYGVNHPSRTKQKLANLFISLLNQAQIDLFNQGYSSSLGVSPIGFENLNISCHSTDANSGVVYLYGFSDNLSYFDLYRQYIKEGTIVLDVGANLGIHTAAFSKLVEEKGKVLAYEPVADIYKRLQETVQINNLTNVMCKNIGISDITGSIGFDDMAGDFNIGKARIDADAATTIPVTTIDLELTDIDKRISLIKIDVEGFELQVLHGAENTLEKHRPVVVCEFNKDNFQLRELVQLIPFKANYYRVPYTYWDQLMSVDPNHFNESADILIVPI